MLQKQTFNWSTPVFALNHPIFGEFDPNIYKQHCVKIYSVQKLFKQRYPDLLTKLMLSPHLLLTNIVSFNFKEKY